MTLDCDSVQRDLLQLLRRIACEKGRVEILGSDGVCDCVLLSKAELDGLEKALDILARTRSGRNICQVIADLTAQDDGEAGVPSLRVPCPQGQA